MRDRGQCANRRNCQTRQNVLVEHSDDGGTVLARSPAAFRCDGRDRPRGDKPRPPRRHSRRSTSATGRRSWRARRAAAAAQLKRPVERVEKRNPLIQRRRMLLVIGRKTMAVRLRGRGKSGCRQGWAAAGARLVGEPARGSADLCVNADGTSTPSTVRDHAGTGQRGPRCLHESDVGRMTS
jgi:hypothetical protein